jgi:hypothetical protein
VSQIANITVFDGAATPVSHTLVPMFVSRSGNEVTARWQEMLPGVPAYAQVYATAKLTTLKSGTYKAEFAVVVPVMEAILNQNAAGYTAAPKVAFEDKEVWTGFFAPRSAVSDRRLARQMLVNISGNISTSVAASTSGPFSELFDQLVMPT